MKKIEIVWNQLLYSSLENRQTRFQIQELASNLKISTSTVHHGLIKLKQMGAVKVGGNGGEILDTEKILMHWANQRRMSSDIEFEKSVKTGVLETEGLLPSGSILGAYSAVRHWFEEAPADYQTVYVYHKDPKLVQARFKGNEGNATLLVGLRLEEKLATRPETTSLGHTFVDLWNIKDWMAKEFIKRIREEMDEVLS